LLLTTICAILKNVFVNCKKWHGLLCTNEFQISLFLISSMYVVVWQIKSFWIMYDFWLCYYYTLVISQYTCISFFTCFLWCELFHSWISALVVDLLRIKIYFYIYLRSGLLLEICLPSFINCLLSILYESLCNIRAELLWISSPDGMTFLC